MKFTSSVDAAAARRRGSRRTTLAATLVCVGLLGGMLAACGQKGPLSLPKPAGAASAPAGGASGAAR